MNTPDYQDISQENPERIARQEAERAAVRARNAEMKNALKARSEARRPAIEAAKAERQAIADRNLAMQKDLPLGSVISGLTQSMINQGASPEQRSAAVKELMAAHRAAPRDVRGNTDMSALVSLLGKYTTQDQMNAALAERGRTGRFNAFDTYKTGLADFNQRAAADVAADQKARADIERSFRTQWGHAVRPQVVQPVQPEMPALPAPVPQPLMALDERGNMLRQNPNSMAGIGGMLSQFAEQFRNAEGMPSTGVSAPRQLTQEEAMRIASMPSATRTAPAPSFMPPRQPAMIAAPGGSTGFDERTGTYTRPPNIFGMFGSPLGMRPQPQQFGSGFTVGGLLGRSMGMMQPQPVTPSAPPMAYKKGGAVKPVWDKKRPDDLGKPKALSVKKKKAAKARAAAAGRPYPNLIDNMAAARKKGK